MSKEQTCNSHSLPSQKNYPWERKKMNQSSMIVNMPVASHWQINHLHLPVGESLFIDSLQQVISDLARIAYNKQAWV